MLNKRIEPELLNISPDLDQVDNLKQPTQSLNQDNDNATNNEINKPAPNTKSNGMVWLGALAIIGLTLGGLGLYKQNQATHAQLLESQKRITELERTLSATGEEMGVSAGAIQAKLTKLTERTDELWTQMDKLWASAWRRNQSEIKKLKEQTNNIVSTQNKTQSELGGKLTALTQSQSEQALKLSVLQEQQQAAELLKRQLREVNTNLDTLKSQSQSRDAKQVEIGATMAQLELTQAALAEKLQKLESTLQPQKTTP